MIPAARLPTGIPIWHSKPYAQRCLAGRQTQHASRVCSPLINDPHTAIQSFESLPQRQKVGRWTGILSPRRMTLHVSFVKSLPFPGDWSVHHGAHGNRFHVRVSLDSKINLEELYLPEVTGRDPFEKADEMSMLGYDEFDQKPHRGWRAFADKQRYAEAAVVIENYLQRHGGLDFSQIVNLHFHAAQNHAFHGTDEAIQAALKHLKQSRYQNRKENFLVRWNDYVDATEAFLRKDLSALKAARERIAKGPETESGIPNLDVVDQLIRGFGKTYREAYSIGKSPASNPSDEPRCVSDESERPLTSSPCLNRDAPSPHPSPPMGARICRNEVSRREPLNRSSRREEALISFGQHCMSLLTSAATRFTGRVPDLSDGAPGQETQPSTCRPGALTGRPPFREVQGEGVSGYVVPIPKTDSAENSEPTSDCEVVSATANSPTTTTNHWVINVIDGESEKALSGVTLRVTVNSGKQGMRDGFSTTSDEKGEIRIPLPDGVTATAMLVYRTGCADRQTPGAR